MSLRNLILNNFWIKLLSVLLATGLWITVRSLQEGRGFDRHQMAAMEERKFYRVPITVMKSATDDYGIKVTPGTVDLVIGGPPLVMRKITSRDLQVFVDLTDVNITEGLVKKIQVYHPPEIVEISVSPPTVRVERVHP